ncbi:MAG: hypothetical protein ACRC6B_10630 [Fusobacteriaceae bacterium]
MNYGNLVGQTVGNISITQYDAMTQTLYLIEIINGTRYVNMLMVADTVRAKTILESYGFETTFAETLSNEVFQFTDESYYKFGLLLELNIFNIQYQDLTEEEKNSYNTIGHFLADGKIPLSFLTAEEKRFILQNYGTDVLICNILDCKTNNPEEIRLYLNRIGVKKKMLINAVAGE